MSTIDITVFAFLFLLTNLHLTLSVINLLNRIDRLERALQAKGEGDTKTT